MRKGVLWVVLALLGVVLAIGTALMLRITRPAPELSNLPSPAIAASPSPTAVSPQPELPAAPFPEISAKARNLDIPIIMYHDVKPVKDVDWDITPDHLAKHFQTIQEKGLTPITLEQLVQHLRTGATLPPKPILLTFDDNYLGEYEYAFPLLKQYNYPAVWSVHTHYVGSQAGKPKATWEQLQEMVQSGLITVASHTVNHLRLDTLSPEKVTYELQESKRVLEQNLGVPIQYFTYPEGDFIESVKQKVTEAGYLAALSMSLDAQVECVANKSDDLLSIMRFGQSRFEEIVGAIANRG
ncbi:polysaccharide deacetylase family protein [Nodosilinea nodulosa]|uniref:polysaccharide deacetylase family protein n=1 Tax=Nodosilinea nodulosa TaxID=416001 RepID=UPI001CEDE046|nr:polysaccharide deacetylase family protein [Nodosilinea nodulosa]